MRVTDEGMRQLLARFDAPAVEAVLLAGSYARGDAGPHSDIDLLRLTPAPLPDAGTHYWEGKLVNVSDAVPKAVEAWFVEPERAVDTFAGLREARVLRDREGAAARLVAEPKLLSGRLNCRRGQTAGRVLSSPAGRRRRTRVWGVCGRVTPGGS